ncbi:MAG: DUF2085 domain-containing protein [Candidatus Gastranaerophilales bacterium]|nr:DUF2085 domain-containing protein [Candidatus Gastranaerophilales bacterium]
MRQKIRKIIILFFCLYSAFFFLGSLLAPIMAYMKQYDFSALLTSLYMYSCHQQPDRSFWIFGYPMALCSRCFGFYFGVIVFGIFELLNKLKISLKTFIILLIITVIDIIINYGLPQRYNTGNITRFVVGMIMGLLFVVILSFLLKKEWRVVRHEN